MIDLSEDLEFGGISRTSVFPSHSFVRSFEARISYHLFESRWMFHWIKHHISPMLNSLNITTHPAFTGAGSGAVCGTVTAGSFGVRPGMMGSGMHPTDGRNVRQQGKEIQQRPSTRLKKTRKWNPQSWTAKDLESFHGEKRLIVFLGGMHTKRIIETRVPNAG